jgi:hypothetical protein
MNALPVELVLPIFLQGVPYYPPQQVAPTPVTPTTPTYIRILPPPGIDGRIPDLKYKPTIRYMELHENVPHHPASSLTQDQS